MFSKKGKLEKQLKNERRENRKVQRDLERDRAELLREENKIKADIKRLAAQGNKEACAVLAKQLVKNRQQVARSYEMTSRVKGVAAQESILRSNMRVTDAAKTSTSIMSRMNKQMDKANTPKVMQEFSKQSMKMSITEEALDDALAGVFDDNEEAEDAVIQQVLDELGIETNAKLAGAPTPSQNPIANSAADRDTDDITAQLDRLRSP